MKKIMIAAICLLFAGTLAWSQKASVPEIGATAPSFTAMSTNGIVHFPEDYGKNWKILFSHPKDFTPVCSSEILELAYAQNSFNELGAKLVVFSTDLLKQHQSWKAAIEEISYKNRQPVKIEFPIVADNDGVIARMYGMIHTKTSSTRNIRGVYFIDPDNVIRAILFYPDEVGRNVEELKRTLIALETNYKDKNVVTPADWQPGDDVIVPVLTREERDNLGKPGSDLYEVSWFMVFKSHK